MYSRALAFYVTLIFTSVCMSQDDPTQYVAWLQQLNVPTEIANAFQKSGLDTRYEYSFHINPFYLRGDFDGDGKSDIAILVKEKSTNKTGIAVFHIGTKQIVIIGAGKPLGNFGDDLRRINVWSVYRKSRVHPGTKNTAPVLRGEAIRIEVAESASGLIYWNGKSYHWYPQGD
jgi:hypothetical protein